ncbi:MAG: NAD(P)H-quinone oxidoreductase subunit 3 [Chloroflexota bacterium]|jgi:NAD(P)H-quinone oxidoreductase subunit 3|nr:NAD(P)H-quinone oxidoreductase subunit 3 [Chloroflexota bacterium]
MQPFLGHIALYALIAAAMPGSIVLLALILTRVLKTGRGQASTAIDTYESGMVPIGEAWIKYHIQYYMYALVFVVFDVEVVFLYPWAVVYRQAGVFALVEIMIFIVILLVGLAYAWRRGALRWT